jgi:hypothetical protein
MRAADLLGVSLERDDEQRVAPWQRCGAGDCLSFSAVQQDGP